MDTRLLRNRPSYTLDRETSPAMWLVGTLWLIHATGIQTDNRSSFIEQVMPGGLGPPTHRHPLAVEGFYVLEGTVDFHLDGRIVRAEAGTLVHIPRMIPHTFAVASAETRVLNWYAPAGNEIHVIALARPADERRRPTLDEGPPPNTDELNQILSRLYGSNPVTALPFSVPPREDLLATEAGVWGAGMLKTVRAEDGEPLDAFGLRWRMLATAADTDDNYDLFEVTATPGTGMPHRLLGVDEALYVLDGSVAIESNGEAATARAGSFTYLPAGSVVHWRAPAAARLLVFHLPGGFDRALTGSRGQDALAVAAMEAQGTRFLEPLPLDP